MTPLLAAQILGDAGIALAYVVIATALLYFATRRPDFPVPSMLVLFGAFILACSGTHVLAIVVAFTPLYWVQAAWKGVTAILALVTAAATLHHGPALLYAYRRQVAPQTDATAQIEALRTQFAKPPDADAG